MLTSDVDKQVSWLVRSSENMTAVQCITPPLEKRDRLRSLPLYSSKITGYEFFCSPCWDKAYLLDQERRNWRKEQTKIPKLSCTKKGIGSSSVIKSDCSYCYGVSICCFSFLQVPVYMHYFHLIQ